MRPTLADHIAMFRASVKGPRFRAAAAADKTGSLYIYDAIGDSFFGGISPRDVVDALAQLKQDGCTALNIYINSPGGDVFDGAAMYNAIQRFEGKKTVIVDGLCASAASLVAMAGDVVQTAANAEWMIHNAWGYAVGNAADMRKVADRLDQVSGTTLLDTYAARCGDKCTKAKLQAMMDEESWLTPTQALECGLTDEVLEMDGPSENAEAAAAAIAHPILNKFKNTPNDLRAASQRPEAILNTMRNRLERLRARSGQPARKK